MAKSDGGRLFKLFRRQRFAPTSKGWLELMQSIVAADNTASRIHGQSKDNVDIDKDWRQWEVT